MRWHCSLGVLCLFAALPLAAEDKREEGFVPLFNGKDLTGFVNVNCHPNTFFVKDGMLVTTGKPTGFLRTEKQYENFIAEFEWMHVPDAPDKVGNSGFFVWGDSLPAIGSPFTKGIEVQVLVNLTYTDKKSGAVTASSHGDIFSIWGATCLPDRPHPTGGLRCIPSENRAKGANEWNHYRVEAIDGVIKLAVNGKFVSGVSKCNPRKGYLAFESEGSECRFKNIKIKELPSSNPKPEEIASVAKGFTNVITGLDLDRFKKDPGHDFHWEMKDWMLHYDGKSEADPRSLYVLKEYGEYEMVVDWRLPGKKLNKGETDTRQAALILFEDGDYMLSLNARADGRLIVLENIDSKAQFLTDKVITELKPTGQWNRTFATIKGGKLSVTMNGKVVVENIALTKLPRKGEIALMDTGTEIDFANLQIREMK
ncbi:MAG: DUF1080 domain-containing protein [Planctomycetes bacterium]|nr:DUF1080 domain-containing protein [Planctomycetota bacterium]